jgi:phage gpG-like protein
MRVSIEASGNVIPRLAKLQDSAQNLAPAMELVGQAMERSITWHFNNQRSPDGSPFKPLTLPYLMWKQKHGGGNKILVFKGTLKKSIRHEASRQSVRIFSDVPYAAKQNEMRPFMGFSDNSKRTITSIVMKHLKVE